MSFPKTAPPDWLARIQSGAEELIPLEDFAALPDGLEWRLSHFYWETKGVEAFYTGDVPYISINDGRLSEDAADLLIRSHGRKRGAIRVMELGAGSGLFAKLFLDHVALAAPMLYRRLEYVVTDGTQRIVDQLSKSPLFEAHRTKMSFQHTRAPELEPKPAGGPFDLIIANYFLDILPATTLFFRGKDCFELEARACLRRDWDSHTALGLSRDELQAMLAVSVWTDPRLAELHEHLVLDCRYVPVDRKRLPQSRSIPSGNATPQGWWSHGAQALDCLEAATGLLASEGYLLIQDYAVDPVEDSGAQHFSGNQHFGGSLSNGVNFTQLAEWAKQGKCYHVEAPKVDSAHVRSRWIGQVGGSKKVRADFCELFDGARRDAVPDMMDAARDAIAEGHLEIARERMVRAATLRPRCWHLLERFSAFQLYQMKNYPLAREIANAGLAIHPDNSSLYNDRGDTWYFEEQYHLAEADFLEAIRHNPCDIRARFNLANCYAALKRHADALRWIAEALSYDQHGMYRDGLLAKQGEILAAISERARHTEKQKHNRFRNAQVLPVDERAPSPREPRALKSTKL